MIDHIERAALKALTNAYITINTHYKLYRKILRFVNPHFKPLFNLLDYKMIVSGREIPLRVFYPREKESQKVIIFFHGGGWVAGNIDSYTRICSTIAQQTKHVVISVNYRLAPENPFPAGLEDCYYVTEEILKNPCMIDCKWEDITLMGDSAGGNLAAAVSQMARDNGGLLPRKQILLYPATYSDHSESSPFKSVRENGTGYLLTSERVQKYMDMYVQNEKDKCSPYAAPLLAKDFSHQPKTLIITAQYDPLRDEGEAYGSRLRAFNNDVTVYRMQNALHGFLSLPAKSKTMKKCYKIIGDFLRDEQHRNEDEI